jgi:hypothetical protein
MHSPLHRLVYCSHSELKGTDAEVSAGLLNILSTSRMNNSKADITGALLYHGGEFTQFLEGPKHELHRVLEVIHADSRHSRLTIAFDEEVASRAFPLWSMGFACRSRKSEFALATAALEAVFAKGEDAGEAMFGVLRQFVVCEKDRFFLTGGK